MKPRYWRRTGSTIIHRIMRLDRASGVTSVCEATERDHRRVLTYDDYPQVVVNPDRKPSAHWDDFKTSQTCVLCFPTDVYEDNDD